MARVDRGRKARSVSLPAPVGGLNTRDALAAMEPIYAHSIENWFPAGTHLEARKGYAIQTTVTGASVFSAVAGFIPYGDASLWVAVYRPDTTDLVLKDVVAGTTVTIAAVTTVYTAVSSAQFSNSAGAFVAAVFRNNNATDNYYTYDGTTWTARTAATTNSQAFSYVAAFRNRLWFLSDAAGKNLTAFYLPTSAITGTTVEFQLGGIASKGGSLYAIGTWTLDAGTGGSDDLIVFSTTNGQAIVYQGTDPSASSTFALVGVFDLPRPCGRPFKYGSDILMPTEDGLYSMTEVLRGNVGPEFAVSSIIRPTWQGLAATAIASLGANINAECVSLGYSATLNHLWVKFRTQAVAGTVLSTDLVMNPITKAWTTYPGGSGVVNGYSIGVLKGYLYTANIVGSSAVVWKFGVATTDEVTSGVTSAIQCKFSQAYSNLGIPGANKQLTALKASFTVAGNSASMGLAALTNYSAVAVTPVQQTFAAGSYAAMFAYPAYGAAISAVNLTSTSATASASNSYKYYSTDLLFVPGGFV